MPQVINTNVASLNAQRNLNSSQSALATSLQRLSSGLRINSAKDDAAGLAISNRMSAQIRGLNQASRNANDGISLAQTAEGSLQEIGSNLQRLRELSLQSANSTNSASDRSALNAEVQSLLTEVSRVANTTQFNGLNLLDGTFQSQQFQVGANASQVINVTVTGATTDLLGSYQVSSANVTSTALDGANFTINGITIGASAQTTSAGVSAGSAAAKATAINAKTAETGVTATASTTISGQAPGATGVDLANGALKINGIAVGAIASAASKVTQSQNAATEINKITSQTGVTATVNMSTGALTLTSSEGRDIKLESAAGTAAQSDNIYNTTGLDVSTGANPTGNDVMTLTVGGPFDLSAPGAGSLTEGDSFTLDGLTYEFTTDATVTSGRVAVTVADGNTATQVGAAIEAAVDAQYAAGTTSVSAASAAGVVTLTNNALGAAGTFASYTESISAGGAGALVEGGSVPGTAGTFVAGGITTTGTLTLNSAKNFSLGGSAAMLTAAGLSTGSASLAKLSSVDVSTVTGANNAIAILDGALSQVDSIRGELGAVQNRFTSTITSLNTTAENLSAARSRIQDADFAAETAILTRGQILQQAGVAMLAQANSLPQNVLSLLRG